MSDYNPQDPLNRGYNPNVYDKYGNAQFEPADGGRGPYVLLAILALIGLVGGLLYFNGPPKDRTEQAQMPDRPMSAPATPGAPAAKPMTPPAAPAAPAMPGANSATPSDNNAPIKQ